MKNHHKKALTRKEKIEQARAVRKGVITNPRHLIGLAPGEYTVEGEAAALVAAQLQRTAARSE